MIHSTIDSLYEYVPKSHLPSDYGGECPDRVELNCEYQVIFIHTSYINVHESKNRMLKYSFNVFYFREMGKNYVGERRVA